MRQKVPIDRSSTLAKTLLGTLNSSVWMTQWFPGRGKPKSPPPPPLVPRSVVAGVDSPGEILTPRLSLSTATFPVTALCLGLQ